MPYQNVGTPKFYISWGDWYKSLGYNVKRFHTISPIETISVAIPENYEYKFLGSSILPPNGAYGVNFLAVLNHNLDERWKLANKRTVAAEGNNPADADYGAEDNAAITPVVNQTIEYKGFTIYTHTALSGDFSSYSGENVSAYFRTVSGEPDAEAFTGVFGCFVFGKTYTIPHSPEKLTMTREMDGVRRIRTKGGSDLVKHQYTKPAMWGDAGAWELYSGTPTNQALSRSGRRIWDLSFSYLQDSDIFPEISTLTNYEAIQYHEDSIHDHNVGSYYYGTTGGGLTSQEDAYSLLKPVGTSYFYSEVIHKTNGGQLPFIFQPDKNDNTNFAICKFDQKSFSFQQIAPDLYSVKMKIREVW